MLLKTTLLSLLLVQASAFAQTVTPPAIPMPQGDPFPYQNQTILRLSDTTIEALNANAFDFKPALDSGNTVYPNTLTLSDYKNSLPAIQALGANYAFFKNGTLGTISATGGFFNKGIVGYQPGGTLGGVYFTKAGTNEIVAIDSSGIAFETGDYATGIRLVGGNFYIDQDNRVTAIKSMGSFYTGTDGNTYRNAINMVWHKPEQYPDAVAAGGNYFIDKNGDVTVVTAKDGFVYGPIHASAPTVFGGNYFVGHDGLLWTISSDGKIFKCDPVKGAVKVKGYSYFITADGTFTSVDASGTPHTSTIRVRTDGKIEILKTFKGGFEAHTQYVPGTH